MKNKTSENMQKMYADKRSATLTNIQNAIDLFKMRVERSLKRN